MEEKDFDKVELKSIELIGWTVVHTLSDDKEWGITGKMLEKLKAIIPNNTSVYLVQLYDEYYELTQQITTFIGSEELMKEAIPDASKLNIPKGLYFKTKQRYTVDIDQIYVQCYDFFDSKNYEISANFDFERISPLHGKTELFFPIIAENIRSNKPIEWQTFCK